MISGRGLFRFDWGVSASPHLGRLWGRRVPGLFGRLGEWCRRRFSRTNETKKAAQPGKKGLGSAARVQNLRALLEHSPASHARKTLRVPAAEGSGDGRRPRTVRSRCPGPRVGDPWSQLQLRHRLPSRCEDGAAGVGPGPLPFLERLCGALLRGASGQGQSGRVCVARAAPVTPSSSCRNRRPLPALAGRAFYEGAPEAKLGVRPRKRDRGDPRSPEAPFRGRRPDPAAPSAAGESLIKPSGGAGPEGAGRAAGPAPASERSRGWTPSAPWPAPARLGARGARARGCAGGPQRGFASHRPEPGALQAGPELRRRAAVLGSVLFTFREAVWSAPRRRASL